MQDEIGEGVTIGLRYVWYMRIHSSLRVHFVVHISDAREAFPQAERDDRFFQRAKELFHNSSDDVNVNT